MQALRVRHFTRAACVGFAVALLAGCSHFPWRHGADAANGKAPRVNDCNKPQGYEDSGNNAPLRVPAGLDPLNSRGALRIPDLREPEAARKLSDPCLEEPPKYAANVRLLPPVLNKQQRKEQNALFKAQDKAQLAEAKRKQAEDKRKRAEEKAAKKAAKAAAKRAAKDEANAPASVAPAAPQTDAAQDATTQATP
jgi:type IV secretory pathway VirB10-like protein